MCIFAPNICCESKVSLYSKSNKSLALAISLCPVANNRTEYERENQVTVNGKEIKFQSSKGSHELWNKVDTKKYVRHQMGFTLFVSFLLYPFTYFGDNFE